ncbi:magnesium and cobalt transport protein CorA [Pengzhenrongella frigida]|uniref:magnesium and cobalt transport protein CorA n=1 Tax=Pengzhenrongella frigida TaxID=1259133 RepID=UPI0013EC0959|nr:magnesium and cobalt transport protein CorA [Cellulomonas sp. HLT2-17]
MSHLTAQSGPVDVSRVLVDHHGTWVPTTLDAAVTGHDGSDPAPVWVSLGNPEQLESVAQRFGVPLGAVQRADQRGRVGQAPRPHLERLPGGGLFLSSPTLSYVEQTQDVQTGTLTMVVAGEVILTVEHGDAGTEAAAVERLGATDLAPEAGARQVLAVLLLSLVSATSEVEIALGEAVADTERATFSPEGASPVQRIYRLKREIAEARRALVPFSAELPELVADDEDAHGSGRAQPWLHRLEKAADRLDRRLEGHDRLLGDMLSAYLSQVSVRQNEDVRKISAWAAIAVVPTLVASVYGMNFQHMPELSWSLGYPGVILAMVGSCVVLFNVFKRSGWL